MNVQLVRQEDPCGCLVACLAMVTGRSYGEVKQHFLQLGKTFEGERGGLHELDVEQGLADFGFAYAKKYRWRGVNLLRTQWPAPPFAPVHIVGLRVSAGWHGVVLLQDGRVLDPFNDERRDLTHRDYEEIGYILGVFRIADGKAVASC